MSATRTLVLFDVDGTLLDTTGAGIDAVAMAGRELHGDGFDPHLVDYAGRLDPVIFRDLLRAHELAYGDEDVALFRERYGAHLPGAIGDTTTPCPGVVELIDALDAIDDVTLGLLTGNFPETGAIKLRCCGLDPERFGVRVWSTCPPEPERSLMPPVGVERWRALHDGAVPDDPRRVVVIGDTPEDVRCARANACRCLGVATGRYSAEELLACGADRAEETLESTSALCAWISGS